MPCPPCVKKKKKSIHPSPFLPQRVNTLSLGKWKKEGIWKKEEGKNKERKIGKINEKLTFI